MFPINLELFYNFLEYNQWFLSLVEFLISDANNFIAVFDKIILFLLVLLIIIYNNKLLQCLDTYMNLLDL